MPELVLALISIVIALPGAALTAWLAVGGARDPRPDPLEEAAAAQRDALTAADTARASAHAANAAELAEFDAEARRILDALPVPCVCSQVSTHEWDEHTQTNRQRWTVPEHFTSCAKHWPATTGTPPPGTIAHLQRLDGTLTAAEVDRRVAEFVAGVGVTPGGIRYRAPPPGPPPRGPPPARQGGAPPVTPAARVAAARARRLDAAMLREHSTTTYGVPDGCTCVPGHTRAALANTHVVHRLDCATNRGPRAAEWRPVSDNG